MPDLEVYNQNVLLEPGYKFKEETERIKLVISKMNFEEIEDEDLEQLLEEEFEADQTKADPKSKKTDKAGKNEPKEPVKKPEKAEKDVITLK